MLTKYDYESLSKSIKGWDAKKLRQYGIMWPPVTGWRQRLLREYRNENAVIKAPRDQGKRELIVPEKTELEMQQELAAAISRKLTADWYLRISGQVVWRPGEKEVLDSKIKAENGKWNRIQGKIELSMV